MLILYWSERFASSPDIVFDFMEEEEEVENWQNTKPVVYVRDVTLC